MREVTNTHTIARIMIIIWCAHRII